jgi:hypothetical protein
MAPKLKQARTTDSGTAEDGTASQLLRLLLDA